MQLISTAIDSFMQISDSEVFAVWSFEVRAVNDDGALGTIFSFDGLV